MKSCRNAARDSLTRIAQTATVAVGLLTGLAAEPVHAGPVDGEGSAGVTIVHQGGGVWVITAPDGSIINYAAFDIAAGEWVHFDQGGNPLARVLNRISGEFGPSHIYGKLTADGLVYFVNPAGVFFGNGAVVDVGGLYAAAGNITDADFLAGHNEFSLTGEVVVEHGAEVRGTQIHLLGDRVANHGLLESDGGIITMLAGETVLLQEIGGRVIVHVNGSQLTDIGQPGLGNTVASMATTPDVENTGVIRNHGGHVIFGAGDMVSLAFRNTGTIEAAGGEINIAAAHGLIQNDGVIDVSVDSGQAGTITVKGPSILNRGSIRADAASGQAGSITVHSQNHTYLSPGSVISAAGGSGSAHGGEVLVNSFGGLTIFADGSIIDVSGGAGGGHGGFAEVSGQSIVFNGQVGLGASGGFEVGTLLIDPVNIIINDTGGDDSLLDDGEILFGDMAGLDSFIAASTFSSIMGNILLQATGSILVNAQIDLNFNNNITMEAFRSIVLLAPITGAHDITLRADYDGDGVGSIWLDTELGLTLSGTADFSGEYIYFVRGDITTGEAQHYNGIALVGTDLILTGTSITFSDRLNAKPVTLDLPTLTINGDVSFGGTVGDERMFQWLEVNGDAAINGGLVRTFGHQRYFGNVTLGADAHLLSVGNDEIRLAGALDGAWALHVETGGLTWFDGPVGQSTALTALTTDGGGVTRIGDDITAGTIELHDAVELSGHATLTGSNMVDFLSTIDGNGFDLAVNAPLTSFWGDVSDMGRLSTDAAGTTHIFGIDISGSELDFGDAVAVYGDVSMSGTDSVNFDKTLDGAAHLHLLSDGFVRFGDDVGGMTALESLRLDVGGTGTVDRNLILIDGNLIRVNGDILLNPDGKTSPALVATIAGRGGDLTIESLNGDIYMGLNEKLTSLGDLRLLAQNGMATVGDLNSVGDMLVSADSIAVWAREGGDVLDSDGNLITDRGADFIAGGSMVFSTAPTLLGPGNVPAFAAGGGLSETLSGFLIADVPVPPASAYTFGQIVLDLTVGTSANDLAEAKSDDDRPPTRGVDPDAVAIRAMDRLGIFLRDLSAAELVGATEGRYLIDDTPGGGLDRAGPPTTAINRLRRTSVIEVIDRYSGIVLRTSEDPATGAVIEEDQSDAIRAALDAAWEGYGEAPDAIDFRDYLETSGEHEEALAYLNGLRDLFREVWVMGATKRELRGCLDTVLAPIVPSSMNQKDVEFAIGVNGLG